MLNHLCQNCKWCPENCSASITNPPCLIKERLGIHLNLRFERGNFLEENQSLVTFVLHSSRQGEKALLLLLHPVRILLEFSGTGGISKSWLMISLKKKKEIKQYNVMRQETS